jgi:chaperonin GroEL
MDYKELVFDVDAREKMKKGVDILANAVSVTLGAKGRNVVIERKFQSPYITKDGVTVAKEVQLEGRFENIGANIVKEVASKTNDDAGDGTTTATVLARSIINIGLKNVAAGANPIDIKRGIDKAVSVIVKSISEQSKQVVDSDNEIKQIATISANNDEKIGGLIAEAMKLSGENGVIKVEEAKGVEDEIKKIEGMEIDRGYPSPHFITDKNKGEVVLDKPYILITTKEISTVKQILNILNFISQKGASLFIIAPDLTGEAFNTLVMNKLQGNLKISAIKAPSFGDEQLEILEDIATLTGAAVISDQSGIDISNSTIEMCGKCDKIITSKNKTVIMGGDGDQEDIEKRTTELVDLMSDQEGTVKDKTKNRLARMTSGVSVVYIGGSSELEVKEKKDRVDDALSATRSAVKEGVVPGGGVVYLRALESVAALDGINNDENTGIQIIFEALEAPVRQILLNAGLKAEMIIENIKSKSGDYGYNVRTDKYEKFFKTGIIDPAKVSRVAIENAASVAGLFLTTECVIARHDDDKPQMMPLQ